MYVFYDSSYKKQAKPIIFPRWFLKTNDVELHWANYQKQESWGKNKGNQQGGNPKSKIYCLCYKSRFLQVVLYHEIEYHPL